MPKCCIVPNCRSGNRRVEQVKRLMYRVPNDPKICKKWLDAIPGIVSLRPRDIVCEKHFKAGDIAREWVNLDANGQIITRTPYKNPLLKADAVPTIFTDVLSGKRNHDPLQISKPSTRNNEENSESNVSAVLSSFIEPSFEVIDTPVNKAPETNKELTRATTLPSSNVPTSFLWVDASKVETPLADPFADDQTSRVPVSHQISQQNPEKIANTGTKTIHSIPESWSFSRIQTGHVQHSLFSYAIMTVENGEYFPVTQKCVTLEEDGKLKYFVYGRRVLSQSDLERAITEKSNLPKVLEIFRKRSMCNGLGNVENVSARRGGVYQDYVGEWRSKACSLLSETKTCDSCKKLGDRIRQEARKKYRPSFKSIRDSSSRNDR